MLNPQDRLALSEALAPPPGFTVDHAVGTTFTLDLESALTVPLSLAAKRVESDDDSLSILDALRRTEKHVDIFAQAGQISMGKPSSLVTLLEESVHQVAQRAGIFHPKVWFLRFASATDVQYRFICASRNLTQDRSWDVVIQLDGEPAGAHGESAARDQNRTMAEFLRGLPNLAIHDFDAARLSRIEQLADEWETIDWELPRDVRELRFYPLGPTGSEPPSMDGIRTLIISPFVTDRGVAQLRGRAGRELHLLSRPEELERLSPESFDARLTTYILDDAAELDADDDRDAATVAREPLSGLHAKVVVHDQTNHSARVLLGSANATGQGWGENSEVMVEVVGPTTKFGVHSTLESLGQLKEEYEATGGETKDAQEEAEFELERMLRNIAAQPVFMRLDGDGPCDVTVWRDGDAAHLSDAQLEWQLLQSSEAVLGNIPVGESNAHHFEGLPLDQITPFIVVTARERGITKRTIVLARLLGDVEHRRTAVLSAHITDRDSFLRLLTMMLDLVGFGPGFETGSGGGDFGAIQPASGANAGLMEALAKALGHGTDAIADVERIVDFISRDEEHAAELLPEGFEELWAAVREAYAATQRGDE